MRVESDVMVDVTRKLLADGVAIFPVHDAAIVQQALWPGGSGNGGGI
jgi:hypothetical protein